VRKGNSVVSNLQKKRDKGSSLELVSMVCEAELQRLFIIIIIIIITLPRRAACLP